MKIQMFKCDICKGLSENEPPYRILGINGGCQFEVRSDALCDSEWSFLKYGHACGDYCLKAALDSWLAQQAKPAEERKAS